MKKIKIIIWTIAPVLLLILAGFYIFHSKIYIKIDSTKNADPSVANTSTSPNLHSFKGVLTFIADIVIGNSAENTVTPNKDSVPPTNSKTQDSYSFAIIGDTKLFEDSFPNGNLGKAVASIAKQNVDMTFAVGDLVFKCGDTVACEKSYADWKNEMSLLISKTYEVVGNHDRSGGSLADDIWQKEFDLPTNGPVGFNKQAYSFDFQNSHFVILDTEKPKGGAVNIVQRTWLKQDLAAHKKQHTFVFFHEPAFATSQFKGKSLDADLRQRNDLWKILADNHVAAVINGHEHFFTRKKIGDIYQFIVGNTDAPENATPKPGLSDYAYVGNIYAIVTISGIKMNLSLYSVDGNLINSFDFI